MGRRLAPHTLRASRARQRALSRPRTRSRTAGGTGDLLCGQPRAGVSAGALPRSRALSRRPAAWAASPEARCRALAAGVSRRDTRGGSSGSEGPLCARGAPRAPAEARGRLSAPGSSLPPPGLRWPLRASPERTPSTRDLRGRLHVARCFWGPRLSPVKEAGLMAAAVNLGAPRRRSTAIPRGPLTLEYPPGRLQWGSGGPDSLPLGNRDPDARGACALLSASAAALGYRETGRVHCGYCGFNRHRPGPRLSLKDIEF